MSLNLVVNVLGNEFAFKSDDVDTAMHDLFEKMFCLMQGKTYTMTVGKMHKDFFLFDRDSRDVKEFKKYLAQVISDALSNHVKERGQILESGFSARINVWESAVVEANAPFLEPGPTSDPLPPEPGYQELPQAPSVNSLKYKVKRMPWDFLFRKRFQARVENAKHLYESDMTNWLNRDAGIRAANSQVRENYLAETKEIQTENHRRHEAWLKSKEMHEQRRSNKVEETEKAKEDYLKGGKQGTEFFVRELLNLSKEKNDFYEKDVQVLFKDDTGMAIVDYLLPDSEDQRIPKEIRYVATKDRFEAKPLSQKEFASYYDSVIYQITLRAIHELFTNDIEQVIGSIAFNGYVSVIDRSTGKAVRPCILSLLVSRKDFTAIDLKQVEFKNCFKHLKGICAASLASSTPIAPIVILDKQDKRFVSNKEIIQDLTDAVNLATMDWEDFEYMVRELFEEEFKSNGGEVKVTRASRDGGVDAVAFDPDPIRGGKIVIQAKRYTNTVGVSAVRDLYGTVMNEGATKGILVTTADYGPDAYEFAKGKPLTLLNGSNLLHLLEKHGHRAKIDIKAAKEASGDESA